MNTLFVSIAKSLGVIALMYVLKIGKEKFKEIEDYMFRIETFHKEFNLALKNGNYNIPEYLTYDFRDYECENFKKMWDSLKEGRQISDIKRDIVAKFANIKYGISGKYINLIIEILMVFSLSQEGVLYDTNSWR